MEFIANTFSALWNSLEHLGVWAYWIVFLIAFADSLFVIGAFTGGGALVVLSGVLVSRGVYDFTIMATFAALGALLGGSISYSLGRFFKHHVLVRPHHEARKHHMVRVERLLEKYDGVGIIIGRFLGPLGSITAFFAGFSGMKARIFTFWNLAASVAWGAGFVLLGALLSESAELLPFF